MVEKNGILELVYTFFVGILLALFVGVGINTFYTPPPQPEWPIQISSYSKEPTEAERQQEQEFETKHKDYNEQMKPYNRNVSMMTLGAAVLLLAISIAYEKKIKLIADGVMLGGLFTLIYSIGRGFASEDSKYVFGIISLGLVVVLYMGYHRFVRPETMSSKKRKK